jgi:hypothetical protein
MNRSNWLLLLVIFISIAALAFFGIIITINGKIKQIESKSTEYCSETCGISIQKYTTIKSYINYCLIISILLPFILFAFYKIEMKNIEKKSSDFLAQLNKKGLKVVKVMQKDKPVVKVIRK